MATNNSVTFWLRKSTDGARQRLRHLKFAYARVAVCVAAFPMQKLWNASLTPWNKAS